MNNFLIFGVVNIRRCGITPIVPDQDPTIIFDPNVKTATQLAGSNLASSQLKVAGGRASPLHGDNWITFHIDCYLLLASSQHLGRDSHDHY